MNLKQDGTYLTNNSSFYDDVIIDNVYDPYNIQNGSVKDIQIYGVRWFLSDYFSYSNQYKYRKLKSKS